MPPYINLNPMPPIEKPFSRQDSKSSLNDEIEFSIVTHSEFKLKPLNEQSQDIRSTNDELNRDELFTGGSLMQVK